MKRIIVRSVYDAFEYVMQHYYPPGLEDMAERSDSYAIISIQDSAHGGFGLQFVENEYCQGVLTLYFDDIYKKVEGYALFDEQMAYAIFDFVISHKSVDTLLIHCYAGRSRSKAVGAFVTKMLGGDNAKYFSAASPNMYVYKVLETAWEKYKKERALAQP